MMAVAEELGKDVGVSRSCAALGVARSSLYRRRRPPVERKHATSSRALTPAERDRVLTVLNSERFMDKAPAAAYASLLTEQTYLCSVRTMYRILAASKQVRERRAVRQHPRYAPPQLMARGPNELWSWDITRLLGPGKWQYYYLYVMLDVYSRYVVGWLVAEREHNELSQALITACCSKQGVQPGQLTIHSDRGKPMTAKSVGELMVDLGVTKTHSRPHVSNDNPFIEAHFKTLKYRPTFPERFGCLEDARIFARPYFEWYNTEHLHSGIGYLTPESVHYRQAPGILAQRQAALEMAHARHPERFVRGAPKVAPLPEAVWINPPKARQLPGSGAPPEAPVCPSPTTAKTWSAQEGSRAAEPAQRTLEASEHSRTLLER